MIYQCRRSYNLFSRHSRIQLITRQQFDKYLSCIFRVQTKRHLCNKHNFGLLVTQASAFAIVQQGCSVVRLLIARCKSYRNPLIFLLREREREKEKCDVFLFISRELGRVHFSTYAFADTQFHLRKLVSTQTNFRKSFHTVP